MTGTRTARVVLVEGLSDVQAIEAAAATSDLDLRALGADLVPMGGATNIGRFLEVHRDRPLAGLCDAGEESLFARALERAGLAAAVDRAVMASLGFFVCDRDLEDELIRALGPARVEAVIDAEGELASLRRLQQMPFHRHRTEEEQLHRFLGTRSGRKHRYARALTAALDVDELPRPLLDLLAVLRQPLTSPRTPS